MRAHCPIPSTDLSRSSGRRVSCAAIFLLHLLAAAASADTTVNLSNGNYLDVNPTYSIPSGAISVGMVTLHSGNNGAVISTLRGSTANDQVGSGGITLLSTGAYLVVSPNWSNGSETKAGAVTFCSPNLGINGAVSTTNSLVGSTINDNVGGTGVTLLSSGIYLVRCPNWSNGAATNAGAVAIGSPNVGVSGPITSSNALVGSTTNDSVGNGGITLLSDGVYLVRSSNWSNGAASNAGAVTWGNPSTGTLGPISSANSFVGSNSGDTVGSGGITLLTGTSANYLVYSPNWFGGAGAVSHGLGASRVNSVGAVSSTNSLVGSVSTDAVGSGGITILSNGDYLVYSPHWSGGTGAVSHAVTSSYINSVGAVSSTNSLVGAVSTDAVGSGGITTLSNGDYLVYSPHWSGGMGAVSHAVTSSYINSVGVVSSSNSLVGSVSTDAVGSGGITKLSNGDYLVYSPNWSGGTGAVSHAAASSYINSVGVVSSSNSYVGSNAGDSLGSGGITLLSGGNYVVISPHWSNGAGAVSLGFPSSYINSVGVVSASNSYVGSNAGDAVGSGGIITLSNGNYVVLSPNWKNQVATKAGAVSFAGSTNTIFSSGVVASTNSLVGSHPNDTVGSGGLTLLSNSNYQVNSPSWCYGAGATTFGSGTIGIKGVVSASNSTVGTTTATPTIAVEQPVLTGIANGSSQNFGSANVGATSSLTFTIRNSGTNDLTLSGNPAVAVSGADAAMFTVAAAPALSFIVTGGTTTFTVQFAPTSGGARNAALSIANSDSKGNPFVINLTGTGAVPLSGWRQQYFGSPDNRGNGADLANPANDGIPNLIKYAFGLDPTQNGAGKLPGAQLTGNNLVISFTEPSGVTGITYGAQWNTILQSQEWQAVTDTGVWPQHIFSVPMGANPQAFMQLMISDP